MTKFARYILVFVAILFGLYYLKENPNLRKSIYSEAPIRVKIDGAVMKPGVYELEAGSNGWDLVEMAGGILPGSSKSLEDSNLEHPLEDGQILILGKR